MSETHWVVWCLPGMDRARITIEADDGSKVACRSFSADELRALSAGIDVALRRMGEAAPGDEPERLRDELRIIQTEADQMGFEKVLHVTRRALGSTR